MSDHQNWRILEQTDQEGNLTKQIHTKNNQNNQDTSWNENCRETIIVSRTDLHVICNKKENDRTTS